MNYTRSRTTWPEYALYAMVALWFVDTILGLAFA